MTVSGPIDAAPCRSSKVEAAGDARLIRGKVAELVTAGATFVREESYGEHLGHVVMLDPEGNEFCVA